MRNIFHEEYSDNRLSRGDYHAELAAHLYRQVEYKGSGQAPGNSASVFRIDTPYAKPRGGLRSNCETISSTAATRRRTYCARGRYRKLRKVPTGELSLVLRRIFSDYLPPARSRCVCVSAPYIRCAVESAFPAAHSRTLGEHPIHRRNARVRR